MDKRYRGFISYSHADEKWALWLHRQLERYRVPGHIRKSDPAIPARLNPIFLDRQELASSQDLGSSIRDALTQSSALLLVCSPDAAASKWVNEEIKAYRQLCPEGNILCFMVAGSPNPEAPDCAFPPALLDRGDTKPKAEPLAADVSEHADGKRGALLKIISGLLGVGVDALRRRDQQRRIRVLGSISALATIVSVVTIVLAISAVNARNEADLRRTQAEELIDFMLVELRSQLEPQGKLSLLDSVGEKAMQYFSALGSIGTEKELLMRAMALRQIGEVRFNQGQLEPALSAFEESHQLTQQLYENTPDNDDILFEHSQSEFWIGNVAWSRHDLIGAEQSFSRYYDFSALLAKRSPLQKYEMELVYALSNLAALARDSNELTKAKIHIDEVIERSRKILSDAPNDNQLRLELSDSLSFLASILTQQARLLESESTFQEAFNIQQQLHQMDIDYEYSEKFGYVSYMLGDVQLNLGKLNDAKQNYQVALGVFQQLVESDPEYSQYKVGYYRACSGLGTIGLVNGEIEEAIPHLLTARNGFQFILKENPSHVYSTVLLAEVEAYLAQHALQNGELDKALSLSSVAYETMDTLINEQLFSSRTITRVLNVIDIHARILFHNGEKSLSHEVATRALTLNDRNGQSNILEKAILAKLYSQVGAESEARRLENELTLQGFRDPRHSRAFAYF
jgi:tetratricopeptide (TPR) repeat protein